MSVRDWVPVIAPVILREHCCVVGSSPFENDDECITFIIKMSRLLESAVADHELKEMCLPSERAAREEFDKSQKGTTP